MTDHYHAIVWIDHREAKVFFVDAGAADRAVVDAHGTGHHLQHKANITGSGHQGAILLTGPGNARLELKNYIAEHRPDLDKRISAVEALDHPSDGQLVALARKFFKADDRMHSQTR
jgi:hypothetical protein